MFKRRFGFGQVFAWDCGDVAAYVPATAESACYWLVDWSFGARTSAAVGELIDAAAAL